jgi:hypothetical protein
MIKNKDIIVVGIQPWDIAIGSNCKNIAEEFSKHNRVLYVNAPLDRATIKNDFANEKVQKRLKILYGEIPDLYEINQNLWNLYPRTRIESINRLSVNFLYDILNQRNSKLFAKQILDAVSRLGFKDYILFNDSLMFMGVYLKELLKPSLYIYYMRDFLTKNPYWKKHGARLEPRLIQTADLVVNNSVLYAEYGAQYNPHSYMVGQGCDTSLFTDENGKIAVPDDLSTIPGPIIGYVGYLSARRLDIQLLEYIADTRKDWSIVLVGPEDEEFAKSALHSKNNVHFLGSRDPSALPGYIKGFDVAINPQLVNEATMGNYPRKIDEYLTMGKPTVGTATKAMEYFKDVTYLAHSHEDYIVLINRALHENSPELQKIRRQCGSGHSWENNVAEIYKYIEIIANEKGIII